MISKRGREAEIGKMPVKYGKGLVSLLPMDESRMIEMIENDVNTADFLQVRRKVDA